MFNVRKDMGFLGIFLLVIFVISAILLIILVLVQDEQGEGLGSFLGGGSGSAFGSGANKVMSRFTGIVGAVFIICSLGLAWVNRTPETGDVVGAARRETVKETSDWWNTTTENTELNLPSTNTEVPSASSGDTQPSEQNQ